MELFVNILALIVALAIVLIPIALAVLLIVWLFKKVLKPKNQKTKAEAHKPPEGSQQYQTGWTWNEQRQLWEHPMSEKKSATKTEPTKPAGDTTYRFSKAAIHQDDIPHEDWRAINDSHYAETKQTRPTTYINDRYVMPDTSKDMGYKSKYLLTKNEWHEHKKLREYAAKKGLQVCPKVRLIDLVTPYGNGRDYMTRFHKVQAKHVDFVLVDDAMHVKAIVELDDSSHDDKERQERDQYVDDVLSSVGYTVIHTRCITENTLSRL